MAFFVSTRERRLWTWTLVAVATIYASLGLARTLADALEATGLGPVVFVLGCLLVLVAVVTQGLRARPGGAEVGVALGIAAVYTLVFARMTSPAERTHLIEYGVVALLVYEALTERARHGRYVPAPALLAVAAAAVLGTIDEGLQALVPSRVFDLRDIGFNALAAVLAVGAARALRWVRQRAVRGNR